jgi:hypothetical protein
MAISGRARSSVATSANTAARSEQSRECSALGSLPSARPQPVFPTLQVNTLHGDSETRGVGGEVPPASQTSAGTHRGHDQFGLAPSSLYNRPLRCPLPHRPYAGREGIFSASNLRLRVAMLSTGAFPLLDQAVLPLSRRSGCHSHPALQGTTHTAPVSCSVWQAMGVSFVPLSCAVLQCGPPHATGYSDRRAPPDFHESPLTAWCHALRRRSHGNKQVVGRAGNGRRNAHVSEEESPA